MRRDVIGFGEGATGATTTSNRYVRVTTTPRAGGADVRIEALRGIRFEDGSTEQVIRLRADHGPRVGERVMVRGQLIKVRDRYYDHAGRLVLVDEDTKGTIIWSE